MKKQQKKPIAVIPTFEEIIFPKQKEVCAFLLDND